MGTPTVLCQAPSLPGELIRWVVLMPNGTTATLTTTEVMELARQAA